MPYIYYTQYEITHYNDLVSYNDLESRDFGYLFC